MKDLFTLNDDGYGGSTETSSIFSQLSDVVNVVGDSKDKQDGPKSMKPSTSGAGGSANESESILASENIGEGRASNSDNRVDEETSILQSLFDAHGIHVSSYLLH